MLIADIPVKFSIPWGNSAGGSYINAIPTQSQIGIIAGRASLTDGFVPVNFQPVASGGVPPFGGDMNGVLFQLSSWVRWQSAGGPIGYDSTFSTAISGYPKGALLATAATLGGYWINSVDSNTTNPDSGGANWAFVPPDVWGATLWTVGGTANAITVTLAPAPISLASLGGIRIAATAVATNTSTTTITTNGFALPLRNPNGSELAPGQIVAGGTFIYSSNGTVAQLLSPSASPRVGPTVVITPGAYSGTVPAWATRAHIKGTGGGGQGGGGDNTYNGGGGGAGGTFEAWIAVTPGAAYSGTLGGGGSGGNAGSSGSNGAATTLTISGTTYTGGLGGGGNHSQNPAGGTSGTVTNGDVQAPGGMGGDGAYSSAGFIYGGNGGASLWGGGGRAATSTASVMDGKAYGSGGGGGYGGGSVNGGTGANGIVVIEWLP